MDFLKQNIYYFSGLSLLLILQIKSVWFNAVKIGFFVGFSAVNGYIGHMREKGRYS